LDEGLASDEMTRAAVSRQLRSGAWLSREVIVSRARILALINLVLVVWAVAAMHRPSPDGRTTNVDFVSFYAAGRLALRGEPALAYDQAAHRQAEEAVTGPARNYLYFFYPPPDLLLCAVLAMLPYGVAFAGFEGLTLLLFLAVVRATAGPRATMGLWLLPALAFLPLYWGLGEGQNALLTASLFGGALLLLDARPVLAGVLFGLLCFKPHFGLLIPLVLICAGRCRCFAAAGGTVGACVALSWAVFGGVTWAAYLHGFQAAGDAYGSGAVSYIGMVNLFGAARLVGVPPAVAMGLQAVASVVAAGVAGWIWRVADHRAVRAAALLSATMVAVPLVLLYDQLLTFLAIVWLARAGGFAPWEKTMLAAAFLLPIVGFPLAALGVPVAPVAAMVVLGICFQKVKAKEALLF
jgi:hypothetical protein